MMPKPPKGIRGFLIDTTDAGRVRGIRDGAVLLEDGAIVAAGPYEEVRRAPGADGICWQHSPEAVVVPGLIDTHGHLPHYPAAARTGGSPHSWLEQYGIPAEREFNAAAAGNDAPRFFEALARNGTTCAMLHAGIYEDSCDTAFEAAERSGLRAIMGTVMADRDDTGERPPGKALTASLEQSERLCRKWHGRDNGRLEYAFSPRSMLACTEDLLREAVLLARKFDAYVQMHLAESADEAARIAGLFPGFPSCAAVLEECGLLGDRTILAHCVHVTEEEIRLLAERHAVVAHCPTANLFLSSGIMPLDTLQQAGLRVALGSDVAAGPELDLWRVMRCTIESQKARSFYVPGVRVPSAVDVFRMATLGAAIALGKESTLGTIDVGKDADLVVLDLANVLPYGSRGNMHSDLSAEEILNLLVYRGGPHAVVETFVRGTSVYKAPSPLLL
jgi:guanine deaminase